MLNLERRTRILELLEKHGQVAVPDLSRRFKTSEVTIRNDLKELHERGLIRRAHGGRPLIPHRIVLQVIWFVLVTGCRWEDVPLELGCSGRTGHRRVRLWEEEGIWDRLHADLLRLLRQADKLDPKVDTSNLRVIAFVQETGPGKVLGAALEKVQK